MIELNTIYNEDCLEGMKRIPDKSIDMILCDLPYGTSACKWDTILPFDLLWEQYSRVIKEDGAIVLFGQEPFSSTLRLSNLSLYKYDWIWEKDNASNFLNKRYQPGKITEQISVFCNDYISVFGKMATSYSKKGTMKYFPRLSKGAPYKITNSMEGITNAVTRSKIKNVVTDNSGTRLPNNILRFNRDKGKLHPTQKPVALCEYLIETYTCEGEVVLDNCIGSGTTAIACINTNRNYIGFELDQTYFNLANERIEKHKKDREQT